MTLNTIALIAENEFPYYDLHDTDFFEHLDTSISNVDFNTSTLNGELNGEEFLDSGDFNAGETSTLNAETHNTHDANDTHNIDGEFEESHELNEQDNLEGEFEEFVESTFEPLDNLEKSESYKLQLAEFDLNLEEGDLSEFDEDDLPYLADDILAAKVLLLSEQAELTPQLQTLKNLKPIKPLQDLSVLKADAGLSLPILTNLPSYLANNYSTLDSIVLTNPKLIQVPYTAPISLYLNHIIGSPLI